MNHEIVYDGLGGGHNGGYTHYCKKCGKSDWIASYGNITQLDFYNNPCEGIIVKSQKIDDAIAVRAKCGQRVGGCEPIETAPKDGTPIILLYFDAGRICWVRYGKFVPPIGWYSINGTGGLHPTHWIPLPEVTN